jgi:RNA polymerase sigma factor (sigma-70 family)
MASANLGTALRQIQGLFEVGTVAGLTDGQLLDRYLAQRDESAFAALVMRHGPMVLGVCRSVLNDSPEVEDAFQATFLVLIRKAGTVRGRDTVGGWLNRVAHRAAVQTGVDRSRQRRQAQEFGDLSSLVAVEEAPSDEDWHAPLHEEVARLPERFRELVVLCYLEGRTHAQAACELRCGEATVRRRLANARGLLHARLTRRGFAISTGALAGALTGKASAAIPAGWIETLATRSTTSATAARLADTLVRSMLVGQIQGLVPVVIAAIAAILVASHWIPGGPVQLGGAGPAQSTVMIARSQPAQADHTERPADPAVSERTLTVSGQVLDADDKPFAGAKVYFYVPNPRGDVFAVGPPAPDAVSDGHGRFQFQVADPGFLPLEERATWSHPVVAALAGGFGPAWASFATADETKELTLKLVRDDVPILGRVIDLEGRPVAGVTVRPVGLFASPTQDLSAWEEATAGAKDNNHGAPMGKLSKLLELFRWSHELATTTGIDGRFRLAGIGRERVVSLWIEGPTIATAFADIHARTRPGPTYRIAMQRGRPELGTLVFHGATFDLAVAPTRPIEGTVRDKDSGKPLAGVSIRSNRFAGNVISGRDHVRTTTGPDGRFRLVGMPVGAGNAITASPGPGQPYLAASAEVPAGPGPEPGAVDFSLNRGVAIRGKVRDKETGKPVAAVVEYFLFLNNPHRDEARRLHGREVSTTADGSFELVGLPGPGLIAARAIKDHYLLGRGADTIAGAGQDGLFRTDPHICQPALTHAIAKIDPAEGADALTCDLALDPGKTRQGTVEGPDGKPIAGAVAIELCPHTMTFNIVTLTAGAFTAIALDPKQPRPLFFRHDERKLAAVVMAKGDESGPLDVRLQPAGTVTGRLVDDEGQPRTGVTVNVNFGEGQFGSRFYTTFMNRPVGSDGRFRIEGLIPAVKYDIGARTGNTMLGGLGLGLTLRPGEIRDLGDVKIQP